LTTTKRKASDLKAMDGHRNYYTSPAGYIYYKDPQTPKFSTGEKTIGRARREVERKKLEIAGTAKAEIDRKLNGITNPLLKTFWDELVADKAKESAPSTIVKYGVSWDHGFGEYWANKTALDLLDDKNIQGFKEWYLENKPTRHAEKTVVHFGLLCKFLLKKKVIPRLPDLEALKNLDAVVAKTARRKKVGRVYDEESEVKPMLKAARSAIFDGRNATRMTLALLLGVRRGMRIDEILSLKKNQIDFEKHQLLVWSTKNHKWRRIPLTAGLEDACRAQLEFCADSEWLFPMITDPTRKTRPQVLDNLWFAVKREAAIRDWNVPLAARFHDLRHTAATRTADEGWPPLVACEMLDMSLDIYQKVYAKPSPDKVAEWARKTFGI